MYHHTWLYNKTKSVLLCILLHASFTPAQDHLLLTADSPLVEVVLLATYLVGAAYSSPSPEGGWATGVRSQTQTATNDQSFVERWPGGLAGSVAATACALAHWPAA